MRDTSLRVPPGVEGVVIGARVFSRKGADKDSRTELIEQAEIDKLLKDQQDEIRIIREAARNKLGGLLVGKTSAVSIESKDGEVLVGKGKKITDKGLEQLPFDRWREISLSKGEDVEERITDIFTRLAERVITSYSIHYTKLYEPFFNCFLE